MDDRTRLRDGEQPMTERKNGTPSVQETFRDELRAKYPSRAKRAAGNSKAASIELFCLECVGSSREAKQCETHVFPLGAWIRAGVSEN
jgi:hypothetical protein